MTDEQIVKAAKFAEKKTEFGELVHSQVSRGVNSAYGIGFLEGAEWAREQMMKEAVEGEFLYTPYPTIELDDCKDYNFKDFDKVRVIVLPKEDKS